jgi:hypothetical protein
MAAQSLPSHTKRADTAGGIAGYRLRLPAPLLAPHDFSILIKSGLNRGRIGESIARASPMLV